MSSATALRTVRLAAVRRVSGPALCTMVGLAGFFSSLAELLRGGIGWDTKFHADSALITRSTPAGSTLQEAYDRIPLTDQFYGVLVHQLADKAHGLFGGSSDSLSTRSTSIYVWQGAVVAVLAWLALFVLSYAVGVVRGTVNGFATWAIGGTLPLWVGMSHLDFLDVGVASGLTMVSAAFMLAWRLVLPRPLAPTPLVPRSLEPDSLVDGGISLAKRWRLLAATAGGFAFVGAGLSMAIRPGSSVVLLALCLLNALLLTVFSGSANRRHGILLSGLISCSTIVGGLGLVYLSHPLARIELFPWLRDCYTIARDFPWVGPVRSGGALRMSNDLPWWYVPGWLYAQTPIVLTLVVLVSAIWLVIQVRVQRSTRTPGVASLRATVLPLAPLLVQGVVLPAAIVATGAVLYDGIRHVLFIIPALCALAACIVSGVRAVRIRVAMIGFVMAANLFALAQWFPYSYAHINTVAGAAKNPADWELDFWGVSAREGIERLQQEGFTNPQVAPTVSVAEPYRGVALGTDPGGKRFGVYMFVRNNTFPASCERLFTIKRAGHTLGIGGRCPGALSPDEVRAANDFGTKSVGDRDQ